MNPVRGLRRARALVVIASAVLVIAILATWIRAQIIDTNGWTQTSVQLLENEKIRELVANDLSDVCSRSPTCRIWRPKSCPLHSRRLRRCSRRPLLRSCRRRSTARWRSPPCRSCGLARTVWPTLA